MPNNCVATFLLRIKRKTPHSDLKTGGYDSIAVQTEEFSMSRSFLMPIQVSLVELPWSPKTPNYRFSVKRHDGSPKENILARFWKIQ